MPTFELSKYKCPRCGNEYEDLVRAHFSEKPCKKCTQLMMVLGGFQRQLLAEEVNLEKEDGNIAKQINDLLEKERISGISDKDEELLNTLTKIMLSDEKRRKKIIKQILSLQKKKR